MRLALAGALLALASAASAVQPPPPGDGEADPVAPPSAPPGDPAGRPPAQPPRWTAPARRTEAPPVVAPNQDDWALLLGEWLRSDFIAEVAARRSVYLVLRENGLEPESPYRRSLWYRFTDRRGRRSVEGPDGSHSVSRVSRSGDLIRLEPRAPGYPAAVEMTDESAHEPVRIGGVAYERRPANWPQSELLAGRYEDAEGRAFEFTADGRFIAGGSTRTYRVALAHFDRLDGDYFTLEDEPAGPNLYCFAWERDALLLRAGMSGKSVHCAETALHRLTPAPVPTGAPKPPEPLKAPPPPPRAP